MNILFFGSQADYSQQVKKDLQTAGYPVYEENPRKQTDLIITASFGKKLDQQTLNSPKYGTLNIHPSLLPKYRGAAPVPWTLLNQETETGVTIFKMNSGIDTGPIIAQEKTPILLHETSEDLLNRLFSLGTKLLISILPDYIEGKITPIYQPLSSPTPYARKLTKKDGFLKWSEFIKALKTNLIFIDPQIRAFYPWPGTWTKLPNNKILKILPNQKIQLAGKQPITFKQFQNGYQHLLK